MKKLLKISAFELTKAFHAGEIAAEEIMKFYLQRMKKYDSKLGAFLAQFPEKAMEKAFELDKKKAAGKPLGKLAGLPIALKDNMHQKGEKTTCGSKFLKNYVAPFSSTVCRLLEEEDAIIVGKTNCDEFGMGSSNENSAFFPCKNPWDLSAVSGGSSGGSAAAVAARLVPLAFGSDTGGSNRQPAALCGITGFKPTYGRVSRYGLVAYASSLDQIGPLAFSSQDAALVMETIGRHCSKDSTSLDLPQESIIEHFSSHLKGVQIGVPLHFIENLQANPKKNFLEAVEVLKHLGAEIVPISLEILKYAIAVYYILATAEASTNLARFDGIRYGIRSKEAKTLEEVYDLSRKDGFGKEVKKRIMLGTYVLSSGFKEAYYRKAQKVRTLILRAFDEVFEKVDAIVMPTWPSSAFALNSTHDPIEIYLQDIFTVPANLGGLPAISVPSGFDAYNKPYAIQFLGPQLHDANVLKFAHAYEMATLFGHKIPPHFSEDA